MSKEEGEQPVDEREEKEEEGDDDDEPDDWDKRIMDTGCQAEQLKMNDCYFDTRDWRKCTEEVAAFRDCWKRNGNNERTDAKDA
ncbi:hypothetical protein AAP_00162 [Ascosphaera apis ARSEF 7405]|uniref:CHCH domain-containing protein n=1 Tax=Ascosphaera apis ARSEF 7405 TaxID=392613 RepID=A0A168DMA0_9EURO|nr:hypothetical protein AAP_00162 [Ascosphaera apis ARSEF 7405]